MHHSFDIELAKKYGIHAAILLEYIGHWVVYNRSLNQNRVDGKFWTYNTNAAMQEQFPYFSKKQIEYTINQLKEAGLILVRKLNTDKMNRTNWFTLTAKGGKECSFYLDGKDEDCDFSKSTRCIEQNWEMESAKLPNDKDLLHYNIANNTLHTNPPLSPQPKSKQNYAEFVVMTETEHQKLIDDFGENTAQEMIEILNNYKGSTGKKYLSDYLAIRNWVVRRWREEHTEKQPKIGRQYKTIEEQAAEAEERLRRKGIFL